MEDYEALLQKAEQELPSDVDTGDRFKVDNIKGHLEGKKTILSNLVDISKQLNRNPSHILKFLLRELATPGKVIGTRAILGTKVSAKFINKKIKKYVSEYVTCPECGKPDTKFVEEKRIFYLRCLACGIKKPIKNI
jgi:translation initiation factor 2 subunit 2